MLPEGEVVAPGASVPGEEVGAGVKYEVGTNILTSPSSNVTVKEPSAPVVKQSAVG